MAPWQMQIVWCKNVPGTLNGFLWLAPNSRHVATPESYSFAWFSILFYQNLHFRVSPSVDIDKAWQSHISLIYPKIGVAE
jgi:hypothetical protein